VRSFKYIRPVMAVPIGKALKTTEWQEGSSRVDVTYEYETEANGTHTFSTSDPTEISYYTQLYLSQQFPLPEKQHQPQKMLANLGL